MIISIYGFGSLGEHVDPSRVAAQVVSGIGFIGAGTIIIQKQFVRGLTTAAGLWATAGIGMAAEAGMYWIALVSTGLALAGLEFFHIFLKKMGWRGALLVYSTTEPENLQKILTEIHKKSYHLVSYRADHDKIGEGELFRVTMVVKARNYTEESNLFEFMQNLPDLTIEKME